jgi:hypothetical protein
MNCGMPCATTSGPQMGLCHGGFETLKKLGKLAFEE